MKREDDEERVGRDLDNIFVAIDRIKATRTRTGVVRCPACDSDLSFSIKNNGHIWGRCSKKGCLEWVQ